MKDSPAPRAACEATREFLPAAALDALADAEMHQVTAHVDSCQPCRAELASMRRVASQLTYAAPLEPIDGARLDAVRARLHARAAGDGRKQLESAPALELVPPAEALSQPRRYSGRTWVMAAALAAAVVALVGVTRDRSALDQRLGLELREQAAMVALLQAELSTRDTLLRALANPEVRVITLTTPVPHAAAALMFWNRATHRWTFVARDLPLLGAGRVYQLWLVVDSRPMSIGLLSPDAQGNARMDAQVRVAPGARPQIAVTSEPAGGSLLPTGEPVIAGSATG